MGLSSCLGGVSLGKLFVSFRDLERVVCSSIDHLRSRIREPEVARLLPPPVSGYLSLHSELEGGIQEGEQQ